jgi:hypothetical protein
MGAKSRLKPFLAVFTASFAAWQEMKESKFFAPLVARAGALGHSGFN